MDLAVRRLSNRLEPLGGTRFALMGAIDPEERAALTLRSDTLANALAPCTMDDVIRSIGPLRLVKGATPAGSPVAQEMIRNAHFAVLAPYPAWAIEAACADLMRTPSRFCPEPADIAAIASAKVTPYRAELRRIEVLLYAVPDEPRTDEDRAKVTAAYEKLRDELAKGLTPRARRGAVPGSSEDAERVAALEALDRMAKEAGVNEVPEKGTEGGGS